MTQVTNNYQIPTQNIAYGNANARFSKRIAIGLEMCNSQLNDYKKNVSALEAHNKWLEEHKICKKVETKKAVGGKK